MMGLQATAGKRKIDDVVANRENSAIVSINESNDVQQPTKSPRWSSSDTNTTNASAYTPIIVQPPTPPAEDCIARLRAVAIPGETTNANYTNKTTSTPSNTFNKKPNWTSPAKTWSNSSAKLTDNSRIDDNRLTDDLDDDELDDYDDFSDNDDSKSVNTNDYTPFTPAKIPQGYQPTPRYPDYTQYPRNSPEFNEDPFQTQYLNRAAMIRNYAAHWNKKSSSLPTTYYSSPQQTIRCDANGKSYLELGSARPCSPRPPPPLSRCCEGPNRWCNYPCYRQRRLAVLNLSMYKLARYRQCSDPSLHRSVLICNTLRLIEREMDAESQQIAAYHQQMQHENSCANYSCNFSNNNFTTTNNTFSLNDYMSSSTNRYPPVEPVQVVTYSEQNLREITSNSGRATPFPMMNNSETDSGLGEEMEDTRINWSSVLSLTSQTDLDYTLDRVTSNSDTSYCDQPMPPPSEFTKPSTDFWKSACSLQSESRTLNFSDKENEVATTTSWGETYNMPQVMVGGS